MIVDVHARNDFAPQDPHNTTLKHTIDRVEQRRRVQDRAQIVERVDVLVIDDENPGVFVLASDGTTLVVACGNDDCTLPPNCTTHPEKCDTYQLRLNSQPARRRGQDRADHRRPDRHRLVVAAVRRDADHVRAGRRAPGVTGLQGPDHDRRRRPGTITRANGSDLGSFLEEGFQKGMRIRLTGTGSATLDGDYVITDLDASVLHVVSATDLPGGAHGTLASGTFSGADGKGIIISQLQVKGVYTGLIDYTRTVTSDTLIRHDGTSWLDAGFLEGQLIQIGGFDGTFKIQLIDGTGPGKTDRITLTGHPTPLPGTGQANLTVTQWADVAHFLAPDPAPAPRTCPPASCGDWYLPITVPIVADPFFQLAPGRENLRTFGKQQHLLSGIRGPLAVEGGTTSADRSVKAAVLLPGEDNRPPFRVARAAARVAADRHAEHLQRRQQGGPERDADVDRPHRLQHGRAASTSPTSSATTRCTASAARRRSASPASTPAGSATARSSIDANGVFTTDGTLSTIEIVNILLGAGNDHLTIQSTLQPGGDFNPITGQRGELAHHGGITAVHGGGNAVLKVDGTFDLDAPTGATDGATVAQITRERRPLVDAVRLRRRPAGHAAGRLRRTRSPASRPARQVRARRHDATSAAARSSRA